MTPVTAVRGQSGPAQHDPQFQWRVACNLYANPHAGASVASVEVAGAASRVLMATAAAAETFRLLGSTAEAVQALGIPADEWVAYRTRVVETSGRWVDIDGVAVRHCGYRRGPLASAADSLAAWRRPLRQAEEVVRRLCPPIAQRACEAWLARECGCGPEYVGVRWPPAFVALVADVVMEHLLPEDDGAAPPPEQDAGLQPFQVYSVWARYGFETIPSPEQLLSHWDTTDHLALEQIGAGRLTRDVLARVESNRLSVEGV